MTAPDDHPELRHTESVLTESLDRHAADAPADTMLLSGVHRRLRRRRSRRQVGAVVLACAAVAVAVTAGQALTDIMPAKEPATSSATAARAPQPGWRWESYKTVQVQVPASWNNYVSGAAPCAGAWGSVGPIVGRPGPWLGGKSTCGVAVMPLGKRLEYLWFDDVQQPGVKKYDGGWTEETREVGGVHLSVLTKDDALRKQILDTATALDATDAYGCELTVGSVAEVKAPPSLGTVTSVDVCEYWGGGVTKVGDRMLIAASRLEGAEATALSSALSSALRAPTLFESGQQVAGCADDGGRTFKLQVHGTRGAQTVAIRYSTCFKEAVNTATARDQRASASLAKLLRTGPHNPTPAGKISIPSFATRPTQR